MSHGGPHPLLDPMAACVGQRSAGAVLHSAFHKDLQSGVPTIGKLAFNYNGLDL